MRDVEDSVGVSQWEAAGPGVARLADAVLQPLNDAGHPRQWYAATEGTYETSATRWRQPRADAEQRGPLDADIRETVREKYAAAARGAADAGSPCCGAESDPGATGEQTFGATLYGGEGAGAPDAAVNASLGCGRRTRLTNPHSHGRREASP